MFNKWMYSIRIGYTLRPLRKGGVSGCIACIELVVQWLESCVYSGVRSKAAHPKVNTLLHISEPLKTLNIKPKSRLH